MTIAAVCMMIVGCAKKPKVSAQTLSSGPIELANAQNSDMSDPRPQNAQNVGERRVEGDAPHNLSDISISAVTSESEAEEPTKLADQPKAHVFREATIKFSEQESFEAKPTGNLAQLKLAPSPAATRQLGNTKPPLKLAPSPAAAGQSGSARPLVKLAPSPAAAGQSGSARPLVKLAPSPAAAGQAGSASPLVKLAPSLAVDGQPTDSRPFVKLAPSPAPADQTRDAKLPAAAIVKDQPETAGQPGKELTSNSFREVKGPEILTLKNIATERTERLKESVYDTNESQDDEYLRQLSRASKAAVGEAPR